MPSQYKFSLYIVDYEPCFPTTRFLSIVNETFLLAVSKLLKIFSSYFLLYVQYRAYLT